MAYEYVPGSSFFHRLDPRSKLVFFLAMVVVITMVADPVGILCLLVVVAVLYKLADVPMSKLRNMTIPLLPVFVLFILLNYFITPPKGAHLIGYLFGLPITIETTLVGVTAGLRFILFIWVARLLTMTTSIAELLVALVKLKVPKEVATALGIAFSSVAVLINQISTVKQAQLSRGAKIDARNPVRKAIALVSVVVPSTYLTILRGMDIARTIEARAFMYNPAGRTMRKHIEFKSIDYVFIAVSLAFMLVILALKLKYGWFDYMFTVGRFLK